VKINRSQEQRTVLSYKILQWLHSCTDTARNDNEYCSLYITNDNL